MFSVIAKSGFPILIPGERYTVYNTRDDKSGYPHFLIHSANTWVWKSAKHFVPCS
ncbi:hypothetical protein SDC9_46830 [bioreactor metagenome]|uniref:Uncharacterized protein n=1 Tax=bioreactor metagenome TaxID=1076179 RepID=A0A644WDG3_9ZZZZ